MRRLALVALVLGTMSVAGAQAADADGSGTLSSRTDYARPDARDLPVRCKPGDIEYYAGKTLGDVFGAAWPAPPPAARVARAELTQAAAPAWPKGLGQDGAIAVVAALVGADGRVLDARPLCASAPAIAKPAVRATERSLYSPARFDGVPGVGVAVRVIRFGVRERLPRPGGRGG
jgi:hypothetical protein